MTGPDRLVTQYGRTLAVMTLQKLCGRAQCRSFKKSGSIPLPYKSFAIDIFFSRKPITYGVLHLGHVVCGVEFCQVVMAQSQITVKKQQGNDCLDLYSIAPYRLTLLAQSYSSNIPITKTTYNNLPKRSATSNKTLKNIST